MTEVEIKSKIKLGLQEILEGISKLETKDIEAFLKEVAGILAQKKEISQEKERTLINKINSIYPPKLNKKYQELHNKLKDGVLTKKEQNELIELTNHFEALEAQKLTYLLDLAKYRGQSLNIILKEFPPTAYA